MCLLVWGTDCDGVIVATGWRSGVDQHTHQVIDIVVVWRKSENCATTYLVIHLGSVVVETVVVNKEYLG